MNRRFFVKNTAAVSILTGLGIDGLLHSVLRTGAPAATQRRVLVLVQLEGGNDGLNTVVPLDQYAGLTAARKNILLPEHRVLSLPDAPQTGLHPALHHLAQRYREGQAMILQGVGCPQPDLSHFKAIDIWHTAADTKAGAETGWLGRYLDARTSGSAAGDPPAIQVGTTLYKMLQGRAASYGTIVRDTATMYHLQPQMAASGHGGLADYYRSTLADSKVYLQSIARAARAGGNLSDRYPAAGSNALADQLKIVAHLISGGLQTMAYIVNIKGFDTHDRQVDYSDTTQGNHAELLGQVSEALDAFMDDLALSGRQDDVLTMVYSEFGRRIQSNASYGCDHGTSGPVLLLGSKVKGGIIGHNPVIPQRVTVLDNLAMQMDFRSVYASILRGWLGADPQHIDAALMGTYPVPDLLRA